MPERRLQMRRIHRQTSEGELPQFGYLFHCPRTAARPGFGPGARAVALNSAAHAGRVALNWPAQSRAPPGRLEAQEGFARLEVALPSRLDEPLDRASEDA